MADLTNLNPNDQSIENKIVNKALTKTPYPYVTGLELKADIQLGDLVFNTIDENGIVWIITDIEGWWNHPDPEFTDLPRGFGDGSYDVRGRYAARQITLNGVFLPPDPSYVQAARDILVEATNLVYTGAWLKTKEAPDSENPWRGAYVRLNGRPDIKTTTPRGRTEFSIGLKSADPLKYELVDDDPENYTNIDLLAKNIGAGHSGSITVTNTGNFKVPVVFEVSGALTCTTSSPAQIKNTTRSEQIDIVASQSSGDTLSMDTYSREVLFNDVALDSRAKVSLLTTWIYLDPGPNTITFEDTSNASSTAVCTILYRSGWIA
jgi:hypothetical protein